MEPINAALAATEALESGEKPVHMQIARTFGVERTTLARRHQGLSTSRAIRYQNQQALNPQQELELTQYIDQISNQGVPPTRDILQIFASQLAQKELGYHWVDRFVQRYPDLLKSKLVTNMDHDHHRANLVQNSNTSYTLSFYATNLINTKLSRAISTTWMRRAS
jgi:hypothetical protein